MNMNTSPDHLYEHTSAPFLALTRGRFLFQGSQAVVCQFSLAPLGTLQVASGRLLIEDPFRSLRPYLNRSFPLPPGNHRVVQTVVHIGEEGRTPEPCTAYLSLILDERALQSRRELQARQVLEGKDPQIPAALLYPIIPVLPNDSFSEKQWESMVLPSVEILTGTVALADQDCFEDLMPSDRYDREEGWLETVFDHGLPNSWFDALDETSLWPKGSTNIRLPNGSEDDRIVLCSTGRGAGRYGVVEEKNEQGQTVAVHLDFKVLP